MTVATERSPAAIAADRRYTSSAAVRSAVVAAAYFAGALIGFQLTFDNPNVTSVWPPTGIAIAALLLFGRRVWPGIAAGAVLANLANGASLETALAISAGNTVAPLLGAALLHEMGFRPTLERLKDVVALVFVGGFGAMLVSATAGTVSLLVTAELEPGHIASTWLTWWVGDAIGVIILSPILLVFGTNAGILLRKHRAEAVALLTCTAATSVVVFATDVPLRYLVFPMILWSALRFRQRGAAALTILISGIAILQRARGHAPFSDLSLTMNVLSLHGFNAAVAMMSLSLAAVTSERGRAQDALRRAAGELEASVARRTAELRASEERMREAQALAHIGSWHWDVVSNRVAWTDELYRIYGLVPQGFPATFEAYLDRVHPEHRRQVGAAVAAALERRGTFDHEYRIVRPTGEIRWVHARGEVVTDDAGIAVGLGGFCHDITERKQVEDSLRTAFEGEREAARRLRAVDEMKNSILAAVSHELRTPLTVIMGVADTLSRPEMRLDTKESRYLLGRLGAHAQRLHRLLMDLLDLDRLNRGILAARPRSTDVRDLVLRVLEALELEGHRVAVNLDRILLAVDPGQVERIVENLLVNAAKHTPSGTRVWVRAEDLGDGVVLIVEDDGPGVAPEMRSVIFQPFRQGDTASHAPGTGIGLSLVSRFAHLNGGRAWLEERPGGGASFRVLLPAAAETTIASGAA